jgi:hypothetical protein
MKNEHLGAFFAPQKTGLCGAPLFAPAPATPWLNPSNPLRTSTLGFCHRQNPGNNFRKVLRLFPIIHIAIYTNKRLFYLFSCFTKAK